MKFSGLVVLAIFIGVISGSVDLRINFTHWFQSIGDAGRAGYDAVRSEDNTPRYEYSPDRGFVAPEAQPEESRFPSWNNRGVGAQ